jgi:ParB-like chromosome segregation protein Spo0J
LSELKSAWPADKIEHWAIEKLIPHARNARTHSDKQVAQLAASLKEYGFTVPVLVDESGTLIAGHGRVLAARKLGWAEIPVVIAVNWSDAKKRAYMIADNRLALNAGWDEEMLSVELDELKDLGVDLKSLGFEQKELNDLIGTPNEAPEDTSPQLGDALKYMVIVECDSELHQGSILEEMKAKGLKCRPSIS